MIQIISYNKLSIESDKIEFNTINIPFSLDTYEINIIDLTNPVFFENKNRNFNKVNSTCDLVNLNKMIEESDKSTTVIVLPKNVNCYCDFYGGEYLLTKELKNIMECFREIINQLTNFPPNIELLYEPNITEIVGNLFHSDFYFKSEKSLTKSCKSYKATTIQSDENNSIVFTTLDFLQDEQSILTYLSEIGLYGTKTDEPEWFKNLEYLNDGELKQKEKELSDKLENSNKAVEDNNCKIQNNNDIKSILYSSGDELVKKVFEILEELLDFDNELTSFEDMKKEDFSFEKNGIHFIGEIKGVNENVQNKHLAQLDLHFENYLDEKPGISTENCRALLIINPLRKTEPFERVEINHETIKNAENKYKSLIIRTEDLLKLLESFRSKKIKSDDILKKFSDEKGLIVVNDSNK